MFRDNFTPNFQVPRHDQEQTRQRPKIAINNDNQILLPEHVPTLGANIDLSQSIEFAAVNTRSFFQQNSFYSQWEIDNDDYDEKRILEGLRGESKMKNFGNAQAEEHFHPNQNYFTKENDSFLPNKPQRGDQTEALELPSYNAETLRMPRQVAMQEVESYNFPPRKQIEASKNNKKLIPIPDTRPIDSPGLLRPERAVSYNAMGETMVSEFIQCPVLDKDSSLKCSKNNSSREEKQQTDSEPKTQTTQPTQPTEGKNNYTEKLVSIQEETKERVTDNGGAEREDESLRNSSLASLQRRIHEEMEKANHVQFNVMIVGASSLGKSTFIDAFLNRRYNVSGPIRPSTTEIVEIEGIRNYGTMSFKIKMIDTPGYSSKANIQQWYGNVERYIRKQFHAYKEAKKGMKNTKKGSNSIDDRRVNIILYFLQGPRISEEDLTYMKKLQQYSNIVPVIAKSDCYTVEEIRKAKQQFQEDIHNQKIELFDFAEALKSSPQKLRELQEGNFGPCPPFIITSSIKKIEISPKRFIYGRQYPWGLCNIEDPNHSDFVLLQTLLGGYVCLEAIQMTRFYYKDYFRKVKAVKKIEAEKGKTVKVGFGVAVAVGLMGAFLTLEKKLLR